MRKKNSGKVQMEGNKLKSGGFLGGHRSHLQRCRCDGARGKGEAWDGWRETGRHGEGLEFTSAQIHTTNSLRRDPLNKKSIIKRCAVLKMWQQLKCINYPKLLLVLLQFSTEGWPTIPLAVSCIWTWNPISLALQPSDAGDHVLLEPVKRCQVPGSPCSGAEVSLCFCQSFSLTLCHVAMLVLWPQSGSTGGWLGHQHAKSPPAMRVKNWGARKEGPLTPLYPLGSKHTSSVRTLYTVS